VNLRRFAVPVGAVLTFVTVAAAWPRSEVLDTPTPPPTDAGPSVRAVPVGFVIAESESELTHLLAQSDGPRQIGLRGHVYRGDFRITRPLVLVGDGRSVLEGSGHDTVLTIESDDVAIENLTVRHSGRRQTTEDAGIRAKGTRVRVTDLAVEDTLFGITFAPCPHCEIDHCRVLGLNGDDRELRGDGIKLWESSDSIVRRNVVDGVRDVVVWYSRRALLAQNTVRHSRYGTHFMYAHESVVKDSLIEDNTVGIFAMYSSRLHVDHNVLAGARGAAGMGIGFKESDGVVLSDNWLVANTTGIYLDRTPLSPSKPVVFERNVIALNDVAVGFLGAEAGISFERNDFRENIALVDFEVDGQKLQAAFHHNHWSDYAGYDLDHDGVGDVPFEVKQLSRELVDSTPSLKLFQGTAAFGLIDSIAHVVPVFSSRVLISDPEPELVSPIAGRSK
jgi:nitrous oxidase accessory protein